MQQKALSIDGISWTASISWKTAAGIIPYVTASEQSTVIAGQVANITAASIFSNGAFDTSDIYGGVVIGNPAAPSANAARRAGVPENIYTFTGTYAFDNGIAINASIIDVYAVFSGFSQAVELPSYTLLNLGVLYETERWAFSVTGKNLSDQRYFRTNLPNLFGSTILLPELPRSVQASFAYSF